MIFNKSANKFCVKKVEELERKSLIEKADVMYKRCKPEENFCKIIHDDYVYDRDKLKMYDEQRHDIFLTGTK